MSCTPELLPCPFCGGEGDTLYTPSCIVCWCLTCGAKGASFERRPGNAGGLLAESLAQAAWDLRPVRP